MVIRKAKAILKGIWTFCSYLFVPQRRPKELWRKTRSGWFVIRKWKHSLKRIIVILLSTNLKRNWWLISWKEGENWWTPTNWKSQGSRCSNNYWPNVNYTNVRTNGFERFEEFKGRLRLKINGFADLRRDSAIRVRTLMALTAPSVQKSGLKSIKKR